MHFLSDFTPTLLRFRPIERIRLKLRRPINIPTSVPFKLIGDAIKRDLSAIGYGGAVRVVGEVDPLPNAVARVD